MRWAALGLLGAAMLTTGAARAAPGPIFVSAGVDDPALAALSSLGAGTASTAPMPLAPATPSPATPSPVPLAPVTLAPVNAGAAICQVRVGISAPEAPGIDAVVLSLRASFGARRRTTSDTTSVRIVAPPPGEWNYQTVLFHGDCSNATAPGQSFAVHVLEAVCAVPDPNQPARYVDCFPVAQLVSGPGVSLQAP